MIRQSFCYIHMVVRWGWSDLREGCLFEDVFYRARGAGGDGSTVAARRAWTLGVLAITSPLFVEPLLQIAERSWGVPGSVLFPTLAVLGFVIVFSSIFSL